MKLTEREETLIDQMVCNLFNRGLCYSDDRDEDYDPNFGLDYVEHAFGAAAAQRWIGEGLPLVRYRAYFKKRGERASYTVTLHPDHGILSWSRWVEDDTPGARISEEEARGLATEALRVEKGRAGGI